MATPVDWEGSLQNGIFGHQYQGLNEGDHPWQEIRTLAQTTSELASQAKEEGRFLGSAAEVQASFSSQLAKLLSGRR